MTQSHGSKSLSKNPIDSTQWRTITRPHEIEYYLLLRNRFPMRTRFCCDPIQYMDHVAHLLDSMHTRYQDSASFHWRSHNKTPHSVLGPSVHVPHCLCVESMLLPLSISTSTVQYSTRAIHTSCCCNLRLSFLSLVTRIGGIGVLTSMLVIAKIPYRYSTVS